MTFGCNRRGVRRGGAAAVAACGVLLLGGCTDSTAGSEQGTDVADIQNDPADKNVFTEFSEAEQFYGQKVTITAEVSENLGPHAFTIADDSGEELLVIYKGTRDIRPESGIKVTGTVKQVFSTAAAENYLGAELNDAGWADDYSGEPYIAATSIETNVEFDASNSGG